MRLTGAQIIIETLIEQGVDTVFGYPGGMVLNIYDELYKSSDRIKHIITCHEQGAAHAADGYARFTGKTGVVIATSGPGATNLVTGIATAYLDSSPIVAITGNVPCPLIGTDGFQEVDISGVTMPITKHNYLVKDIKVLADVIREAFRIAKSGRPGPVLVDVPKDIQLLQYEFEPRPPVDKMPSSPFPEAKLAEAIRLIENAERPFIYAGGGIIISEASKELMQLAELIDAPIGTSMMGLASVPNNHPKFLGMTGMHGKYAASTAMSMADLIIAVGTRFSDRATGNKTKFSQNRKVLHIDIDPAEIGKNIPAYLSIVCDVKEALQNINGWIKKQERTQWHQEVEDIKNHPNGHLDMSKDRLTPQAIIEAVSEKLPDSGIVTTDVGQHQMWTAQYYRFKSPRTFLTSGGLGTMGFGMGAAIGACIGNHKAHTVLFTSDGCFHMNMNELATAVSNELPLVILVLNNNALGMVRQWQTLFFDKRYSQTTLNRKTDFVKLAEAFGAKGIRLTDKDKLDEVLNEAFNSKSPVVIDAIIDPDEMVLPMIPPGGTINDIILK